MNFTSPLGSVHSAATPASRNSHGSSVSRIQRNGGGNQTPAFVAPSSDVETFKTLLRQLRNFNIDTVIEAAGRAEVDRLNADLEAARSQVTEAQNNAIVLQENVSRLEREYERLRQKNDRMKNQLLRYQQLSDEVREAEELDDEFD
jgi:predicted nuclease with TOPRIM domain